MSWLSFVTAVTGWGARLVLVLLVALSVWSVTVMIERRRRFAALLESEKEQEDAKKHLETRDVAALTRWAESEGYLRGLVRAVTGKNVHSPAAVEHAGRSYLIARRSELERGLPILATLGANAPFVGLFGTVLGIIQAFGELAQSSQQASTAVMASLAEALVATAVGLFVAIPAVVAFNAFSQRIRDVSALADALLEAVLANVSDMKKGA